MKKKFEIGLRLKFTVLFAVFAAILIYAIGTLSISYYRDSYMEQYAQNGKVVAKIAASIISGDDLLRYCETLQKDKAYENTQERLNNIKQESGVEYLYVTRPLSDNSAIFVYSAAAKGEEIVDSLGVSCAYSKEDIAARETFEKGIASEKLQYTTTGYGYLASAFAPVKTKDGKTVGLVGVDFEVQQILDEINEKINMIQKIIFLLIIACFFVLLLVITVSIICPIRILKEKVSNMADGILGEQVPIRGNDEITEISKAFNRMSIHIKEHLNEMTSLNEGYHRFVPAQLFHWLGKESVVDIRLGNWTKVNTILLAMRIVNFSEMTSRMTTQEVFRFMNKIYELSFPFIVEDKGVIQDYEQAGFLALYQGETKRALNTAVSIQQKLSALRQKEETYKNVRFSMAITEGEVMLGIVGHEERLEAVTIARQKEIGNYMRQIAQKYGTGILITGSVAEQIEDFEKRYHSRFLGFLHNTEEDNYLKLYDVYDGDEETQRRNKTATKQQFEEGIKAYMMKDFYQARQLFIEVLKQDRNDYAAQQYLYLCDQYYKLENVSEISIAIEEY